MDDLLTQKDIREIAERVSMRGERYGQAVWNVLFRKHPWIMDIKPSPFYDDTNVDEFLKVVERERRQR